ncbi:Fic family protein [Microbacterium sp.]|uniref:Fic family protein n=1 Tax=Microbacterium sp. TaxID=51671 RepID=UPI0027334D99|nr:Fic family protein [Microbacterium sp.]MDP3953191.1 Fic family protein [Microbacterium sp.]
MVGLGAARALAEIYCADQDRPLTESDIRQLHELILVNDSRRGVYKAHSNWIDGASHVPPDPSDTPGAMSELVSWLRDTRLPPLWRAAVTHAWFTHIHPFHDGNGRVARLLSNLVLIRAGMPPLIVSASGDKGAYITALAASDEGGDILPLARVFRDVLSRATQDLADPRFAETLFDTEVQRRRLPRAVRWKQMLDEFLSELAPQLLLHRLNLYYVGEIGDADLARIGSGRPENAWIAKVAATAGGRDLLLHVASPSTESRKLMDRAIVTPSIFVSIRNERSLDALQYLPVGPGTFTYEFTPLVDASEIAVRRGRDTELLPVHAAASRAAEHLARTYQQMIGRPN